MHPYVRHSSRYSCVFQVLLLCAVFFPERLLAAPFLFNSSTAGFVAFDGARHEAIVPSALAGVTSLSNAWEGQMAYATGVSDYAIFAEYSLATAARFGVLQSYAAVEVGSGQKLSPIVTAAALAMFTDTLTFSGGDGEGMFVPTFTLSGRGTNSSQLEGFNGPVGRSSIALAINMELHNPGVTIVDSTNTTINQTVTGAPVSFVFGQPIDLTVRLYAMTTLDCRMPSIALTGCNSWTGISQTDFYHTALLSGIRVLDDHGAAIDDFTITSQSGTSYSVNGVQQTPTIPEPSTLLLVVSAVAADRCRRLLRARATPPLAGSSKRPNLNSSTQ